MDSIGLSKRQQEVMDALFLGEDESDVLKKHKISIQLYRRWQITKGWNEEFERRIEDIKRRTQIIIANYMVFAAVKLVGLVESEEEKTSRQACLDILQMKPIMEARKEEDDKSQEVKVTNAAAKKIMRILASQSKN